MLLGCSDKLPPSGGVTPDGGAHGGDGSSSSPVDAAVEPDAFVDVALEQDYDDVATALASVVQIPADIAIADGINMAYGIAPAGFTNTSTGVWSGTRDTIAYTYTYHCEDVGGGDTYTCGPGTDHIHWEVAANGTAAMSAFAMNEDKLTTHWHIRDIDENQPRVEDIGRFLITGRVLADNARLQLTIDATWTHVRFAPQPSLPFDGSIALTIAGHRSRPASTPTDRDFTMTAAIAFTAGPATITLDGTRTYSVDMATGAVTRI